MPLSATTEELAETCTVYKACSRNEDDPDGVHGDGRKRGPRRAGSRICTPVWKEVEQQYTVIVPHQEKPGRPQGVCKMEQVKQTRTVCKDKGHWEEQVVEVAPASAKACASLHGPPGLPVVGRVVAFAAPLPARPPAPPHAAPLATAVAIRAAEPALPAPSSASRKSGSRTLSRSRLKSLARSR